MSSWFRLLVFFFLSPNFMGVSSGCELGMGREGCRIISNTKGCHLFNQILHLLAAYWVLPRGSSMCLRPAMWPCFPLWDEERVRISDFPCNYLIQNLHYFWWELNLNLNCDCLATMASWSFSSEVQKGDSWPKASSGQKRTSFSEH